ncbi:replicative DNA helicase [Paenibacillus sp. GYB004]|uniref:replicative DNA helicase n=1 Tax=Paenibacillus sp. GYB004 TaxID=2994393 RepID=UPI002F96C046
MENQAAERIPPHNVEAEQAVLGAVLMTGKFGAVDQLGEDHFYVGRHRSIFAAMRDLSDKGSPIDIVTTTARLQEKQEINQIGGVNYLSELAGSVPTAANLEHYVGIVIDKHVHRETIQAARRAMELAWSEESPQAAIAEMQASAIALTDQATKHQDFKPIGDVTIQVFETVEYRFANFGSHVTGAPSGYPDLDKFTAGFQPSDLIIVAARPSVGKTAFALNIAQNVGVRSKGTVAIFSLEMSAPQLVQRMMSAEGNIEGDRLRTGYMQSNDWDNLAMTASVLGGSNIFIDDTPVQTVYDIAAKSRRLKEKRGLGLIVIDYLQLIAGRKKSNNRQEEVSEISRTLKQLARDLNVPVIALSQLSRAVEQRQDKRPMMSDLRESGAIEQDADIVAFLYRDDYYDKESEKKNIIEIIISKHRNGPVGTVELAFLKNYNKFLSLDRAHHEQ